MNKITVGVMALSLSVLSWSALADDKASQKEQCEAMGAQHGMSGEKMDAWMKRCMDINKDMKHDKDMKSEKHGKGESHGKGEKHGMSQDDMDGQGDMEMQHDGMQDGMEEPNGM